MRKTGGTDKKRVRRQSTAVQNAAKDPNSDTPPRVCLLSPSNIFICPPILFSDLGSLWFFVWLYQDPIPISLPTQNAVFTYGHWCVFGHVLWIFLLDSYICLFAFPRNDWWIGRQVFIICYSWFEVPQSEMDCGVVAGGFIISTTHFQDCASEHSLFCFLIEEKKEKRSD